MSRPQFEVADIIRSAGADFIARNRHWLRWTHLKVLLAIARCRTAALELAGERSKFGDPETTYRGKPVCVTGEVSAYAAVAGETFTFKFRHQLGK